MFCRKCGTELPDTAAFCTNCGTKINEGLVEEAKKEKIPDEEIQLRVKPTFKFTYMALPSIIFYIILIVILGVMFAIMGGALGMFIFAIFAVAIFLVVGIIVLIHALITKKQFDCYTYDFYKTKVRYRDSFLNVSEKEVKYKYIREITMSQTFVQRFFNLGRIILFTNAETGPGNGIFIGSVENVNEVYKQIKEIIDV